YMAQRRFLTHVWPAPVVAAFLSVSCCGSLPKWISALNQNRTPGFSWYAVTSSTPDVLQLGAVVVVLNDCEPVPIKVICKADSWLGKRDAGTFGGTTAFSAEARRAAKAAIGVTLYKSVGADAAAEAN